MTRLKVYHYAKCGTCRSAIKWLENAGHELDLIPIVDSPPSKQEILDLIAKSGLESKKFFNVSGEVYKELGLKDKLAQLDDNERAELLAANGKLIKRPVVTDGETVTLGFKPDAYEQSWGTKEAGK
ncbi:arsenate reductase family protein [Saccharibacillus sp. CPCC 101409]|uniref:arsenate reductase family protein n=1 Tax=Saccharibacillus sp. CPCC 101409 TaxID=3058041 RepID=UPI002672152A|nr:arsenate reductase family protein [Saccharibacillus sp. CPCC 101409]MDO3408772.1 arsenate reductase family protein [Saccharibacillus sp. CPCC 101409]